MVCWVSYACGRTLVDLCGCLRPEPRLPPHEGTGARESASRCGGHEKRLSRWMGAGSHGGSCPLGPVGGSLVCLGHASCTTYSWEGPDPRCGG